jgi:hypothetical protein
MPSEVRLYCADRLTSQRTGPIAFRTPLALLLISLSTIAAVWWWLGRPVTLAYAPIDPAAKLDCVSYAPFRDDQTPLTPGLIISPDRSRRISASLPRYPNVSAPIPSTMDWTGYPNSRPRSA